MNSARKIKKKHSKIIDPLYVTVLLLMLLFFSSCHTYKLEQNLEPGDAEFYNKVRYIITPQEKKVFLELPHSERKAFQEEFWEKRDPSPGTEENELKIKYFDRIQKANDLFIGEGRPGWATDRGYIYILFGPPTERMTSSRSGFNNSCREVWYYGNFPVVFVDTYCTGQFTLATYDLSPIRHLNLKYMSELASAQAEAQQPQGDDEALFDFNWEIKNMTVEPGMIKGSIEIYIPYAQLWFKEENNRLRTLIDVDVEIIGIHDDSLWKYEDHINIETDEESLLNQKEEGYRLEIPFIFKDEDAIKQLIEGGSRIFAALKNRTSGKTVRKVLRIKGPKASLNDERAKVKDILLKFRCG
jgi:GWxTD domain-containing protein